MSSATPRPDVTVAALDALGGKPGGVLLLEPGHEPSSRGDHPPPRQVAATVGHDPAHGARRTGSTGFGRDLAIGDERPGGCRRNHTHNGVREAGVVGKACAGSRVHIDPSSLADHRRSATVTRQAVHRRGGRRVITAFVLLDVEVDRIPDVAEAICDLDGVTEVYSVTGRYDLIVKVRVARNEDIADVVTGEIGKVPGILGSETVIAFRTYSEQVLDAGFALGQDPEE